MKNDFLLSHPRNIFVIYFSSNSLFLNSCYMLSLLILKTILCNSDIFFNSSKSPSFIMAIFSTTNSHNSNVIVPKSFKCLVFYDKDTFIELGLS